MANPYYLRPASVVPGTTIRADKYNSDLDVIESSFDTLDTKLQQALFLPSTFSGNPNIPEQTVNDTFIYIDTSGNMALYPIATILEQFELVEQRYNQINAWQAQVAEDAVEAQDAATLSQRFANEAENVEVLSGLYSAKHWAKHAEAQIPLIQAAGQAKVDDAATQVSLATTQANNATTQANNASASAIKADNFANYAYNQLVPNSGGKYSSYHWAKEAESYAQQTLEAVNGDFVPNTRTVNGKALSQDIIIGAGDIQGLSTVAASGSYTDLDNIPTDLLNVGDFGLGETFVETETNAANYIDTGFYLTPASGLTDFPYGVTGRALVIVNCSKSQQYVEQTVTQWNTGRRWFRTNIASSLSGTPWQELWTTENLVKTTSFRDTTAGRITKVGDFGLGRAIQSGNGADLNTLTDAGFYRLEDNVVNSPDPSVSFGQMIVSRGNDTILQIVTGYDNGRIWWRQGNPSEVGGSGSYSDWHEFFTTARPNVKVENIATASTVTRNAPVTVLNRVASNSLTTTLNASSFVSFDYITLNKGRASGSWAVTISTGVFVYPDGTSDSTLLIPNGFSYGVNLHKRSDGNFEVTVLG